MFKAVCELLLSVLTAPVFACMLLHYPPTNYFIKHFGILSKTLWDNLVVNSIVLSRPISFLKYCLTLETEFQVLSFLFVLTLNIGYKI